MAFKINGIVIKEKQDYLQKGSRSRIDSTMRTDLKKDIMNLSKYMDKSLSVMLDVWVEMLQDDEDLLQMFIDNCKQY